VQEDPSVFLAGIDVAAAGNVFALTKGLFDRWPERVRDTPISETAIVGLAVGAAMSGLRPVGEVMYLDFIGVCFDQILNQAAKLHDMTGGRAEMSLVIRTQFGAGRSSGSQHSQSLEAMLAHVPGLTVVMPSTPGGRLRTPAGGDCRSEPGHPYRASAPLLASRPGAARRPPHPDRPGGDRPAGGFRCGHVAGPPISIRVLVDRGICAGQKLITVE
jgi:hypothetical protein